MNDNDSLDDRESFGVEECGAPEMPDEALEAAADGINVALSLSVSARATMLWEINGF
jgi:hypothetical protein